MNTISRHQLGKWKIVATGGKSVKDIFHTMIILITNMNVIPEKQKEVLQTLLAMIETPVTEKGCLSYGVFSDIEDKNMFNLLSEWDTRQHLDRYIKSYKFSILLGTKSLLCEPMKIQIVTVADSEGIEAVDSIRKKRNSQVMKKGVC